MLIDSGAFVNQKDHHGDPLIHAAVRGGSLSILKAILSKFADVNTLDKDNRTPLHLAIDKNYNDMAVAILEYHPNLDMRNNVRLSITAHILPGRTDRRRSCAPY